MFGLLESSRLSLVLENVVCGTTEHMSTQVVNFELAPDRSFEWSQEKDYGLKANLKAEYLVNSR